MHLILSLINIAFDLMLFLLPSLPYTPGTMKFVTVTETTRTYEDLQPMVNPSAHTQTCKTVMEPKSLILFQLLELYFMGYTHFPYASLCFVRYCSNYLSCTLWATPIFLVLCPPTSTLCVYQIAFPFANLKSRQYFVASTLLQAVLSSLKLKHSSTKSSVSLLFIVPILFCPCAFVHICRCCRLIFSYQSL